MKKRRSLRKVSQKNPKKLFFFLKGENSRKLSNPTEIVGLDRTLRKETSIRERLEMIFVVKILFERTRQIYKYMRK